MALAFHSIFGLYGFWLPNDPRGSGSNYVASWELFRYGKATKTTSRVSVAAAPHDCAQRQNAKSALRFQPVVLTGQQARLAVEGSAAAAAEGEYRVHACAILPDHVHLVIGAHRRDIHRIIGHFKRNATFELKRAGHFTGPRPVWGEHGWNVYLDRADRVERAIRYVNENPLKEGFRRQSWSFAAPFSE